MAYVLTFVKVFTDDKTDTIWSVSIDDYETAAGMIAASKSIIANILLYTNQKFRLDHNVDIDDIIPVTRVSENEIPLLTGLIPKNHFGLWVKSDRRFLYDLYIFTTPEFIRGVISMCHNFHVDFRDVIFDLPLDSTDIKYDLEGYDLVTVHKVYDVPDDDDIDLDELDDENIHDPYRNMEDNYYEPPNL